MKTSNKQTNTTPAGLARVLEMAEKSPLPKLAVGNGQLRIRLPVKPPPKK